MPETYKLGDEKLLLNGYNKALVCKMKRVMDMDDGDGCKKLCMCLTPLNCTFKIG